MPIELALATAPYEFDSASDGVIDFRYSWPGFGSGYDQSRRVVIDPHSPRVSISGSGLVRVPILRGGARSFRLRPDSVQVAISLDQIDEATAKGLWQLWKADRPVMFSPWYDPTTYWCSNFTAQDPDGNIATVGQAPTITRRHNGDYWPSPYSGGDGWLTGTLPAGQHLKLTEGMIGHAALIEGRRENILSSSQIAFTTSGTGHVAQDSIGGYQNNPFTQGTDFWLPDGVLEVPAANVPALTNGRSYVYSAWVRGQGEISARVVHNSGGTTVTGTSYVLDPERWTLITVSWSQVGTSATLRVSLTSDAAMGTITAVKLELDASGSNPLPLHPSTSFVDTAQSLPSLPDQIKIPGGDPFTSGAGMTFAFWVKRSEPEGSGFPSTARRYFFSANDSIDFWAYVTGNTISTRLVGTTISKTLPAASGDWEQFVFVREYEPVNDFFYNRIYHNGVDLGGGGVTSPSSDRNPDFSSGIFIGSSAGIANTWYGMDWPMDRCRIDQRARTAADALNDYDTLSSPALRAFLAETEGRTFRFTSIPRRFQAGIFTDVTEGEIVLQQEAAMAVAAI